MFKTSENSYVQRLRNARSLGYKSRILVSLRVLTTKHHHFWLSKYPLGCTRSLPLCSSHHTSQQAADLWARNEKAGFQISNGKWRSDRVKSFHHYNLENNIFQVKNPFLKTTQGVIKKTKASKTKTEDYASYKNKSLAVSFVNSKIN